MAKTKTYTAEVTASNFHNWLLRYTIDEEELQHDYDGDIQEWLSAIKNNECHPVETIDEGDDGRIEIDGEPYTIRG